MSSSAPVNAAKQLFYKITQTRSTIGMPPIVRKNIAALGLKRRNQTIYQKVSGSTAHRLRMVKELVKIDLVDHRKTATELGRERKFAPGFTIEKGALSNKTYQ